MIRIIACADAAANSLVPREVLPDNAHPLEKAVYALAAQPRGQKFPSSAQRAVDRIAESLKHRALVVADGQVSKGSFVAFAGFLRPLTSDLQSRC